MADLRPLRVESMWHRFVAELHKDNADSDQGALEHGGRYNPRREFGALYVSGTPAACRAEMLRRPGVRLRYWHERIKVRVAKAIDLTDPSTRGKLSILQEDLISSDWSLTQDLGRAVRRAGFDALIVPSAAGNHHNLVIFKDLLADDETAVTERVELTSPGP